MVLMAQLCPLKEDYIYLNSIIYEETKVAQDPKLLTVKHSTSI